MIMENFMFGVGGWGYSFVSQMRRLAELEKGGPFVILKPGKHLPAGGITRHIGSQTANPKQFYSNPIRWSGPMRQNQHHYNQMLRTEVGIKLQVSRYDDSPCDRLVPPLKGKDARRCTPPGVSAPIAPWPKCPFKPTGEQRPVALVVPAPVRARWARDVIGHLTGLEVGTVHGDGHWRVQEAGESVMLLHHGIDLFVRYRVGAGAADSDIPPTDQSERLPAAAWDAVVLLADPDPVAAAFEWAAAEAAPQPAPWSNADEKTAKERMLPYLKHIQAVYDHWLHHSEFGAITIQLIDLRHGLADSIGPGDPAVAAEELVRLREILRLTKIGQGGR